ncbi:HAD family hydrolase [Paracoccaceae bacterium GXU_MW_L88]
MADTIRIAMWSGPRNLSTAMMRSFGARGDTAVIDEPFYAHYLAKTGFDHPMREEILQSQPQDWQVVAGELAHGLVSQPIQYQKHMAQHMLDDMSTAWMRGVKNVFLIREPERVVASFSDKRGLPDRWELGFDRQLSLFEEMASRSGDAPLVIDSADIREDPHMTLRALCEALEIPFSDKMLRWKEGPMPEDGIWGKVWYGSVNASTGFAGAEGPLPELSGELAKLAEALRPAYETLAAHKLKAA